MTAGSSLMGRKLKTYSVALFALLLGVSQSVQAAMVGAPLNLKYQLDRIKLDAPALPPMAHIRFCMAYPADCRSNAMVFRGGSIDLTAERYSDLVKVNAEVNRSIIPTRNTRGVAAEEWVVGPSHGDCNDYAVTKRHALL